MPRAKVSGDLLQGIKGISIRDSEGHEFQVDLTQTQPPDVPRDDAAGIKGAAAPCGVDKSVPTATGHFSSDDELHGPPVGVQGSQSSSQRRRVAVRKVSAHRLSQETSSQDDFVDAPPLKKQKPDANKSTVPIGRTGLRTSPRSMTKQASVINKNQVCLCALPNDGAFFTMMFLEHYDGEKRKLDIDIHPLLGSQYRAQILYYMLFHIVNKRRPLPPQIEQLGPPHESQPVHVALPTG
ncbi:unnamed protein product [Urochloa humidicola]